MLNNNKALQTSGKKIISNLMRQIKYKDLETEIYQEIKKYQTNTEWHKQLQTPIITKAI